MRREEPREDCARGSRLTTGIDGRGGGGGDRSVKRVGSVDTVALGKGVVEDSQRGNQLVDLFLGRVLIDLCP